MTLLAQIKLRRQRHGVTLADIEEANSDYPERAAERKLGVPGHNLRSGSVSFTLAYAVLQTRGDDVLFDDWQRARALCTLAVLDGYSLAAVVLGQGDVQHTFKTEAALTRFATSAAKAGDALRGGPHAAVVSQLIDATSKKVRPGIRPVIADLVAKSLASGVLLYSKERGLTFPGLDTRRTKRLPPTRVADRAAPNLLAAVLAAPFDDQPRLVYGDWLSEQNDPQGLLIQVQCASSTDGDEIAKTLIKKHQQRWVAPIRKFIHRWAFKRGFINSVAADFSKFIEGQPVLSKVPLLHAQLTGYRATKLSLADTAPHPTLASVDLSSNRLAERGLLVISKPFFSRITCFDFACNSLKAGHLEALVDALPAGVVRLQLSNTDLTTDALEVLSQWPHFGRLTHLDLRGNRDLDPSSIALLARATSLEYLGLSIHQFKAAHVEQIASLDLPQLTRLALDGCDVGGLPAFLKSHRLRVLKTIDLPTDVPRKVTDALEARFAPAPWPRHFEY